MCTVDRNTIAHVNSRMIERFRASGIPVQSADDNKIIVPVHFLGSRPYTMTIDKVNELYSSARRKVVAANQ